MFWASVAGAVLMDIWIAISDRREREKKRIR